MFMKMVNMLGACGLLAILPSGLIGCSQKSETAEAAKPYPLTTCIVSGETIDEDSSMKPYSFVYEGQEIKLCCKGCLDDFNKEPEKYLAKLTQPVEPAPTE